MRKRLRNERTNDALIPSQNFASTKYGEDQHHIASHNEATRHIDSKTSVGIRVDDTYKRGSESQEKRRDEEAAS
jgi:hypothetical protein